MFSEFFHIPADIKRSGALFSAFTVVPHTQGLRHHHGGSYRVILSTIIMADTIVKFKLNSKLVFG